MFKATPQTVFENLISHAQCRTIIAFPDAMRLERAIQKGEPIPEICKPGALLEKLSAEDREALTRLTSDMTKNYRV